MLRRKRFCLSFIEPASCSDSNPENPRIALSGVRSSWLMFARNSDLTWVAWLRSRFAEARSPYSRAPSRTIAACSARSCTRSRSSDAKSGARLPMTARTPMRRPRPVIGAARMAPAAVRVNQGAWRSTTVAIAAAEARSSLSSPIASVCPSSSSNAMRADCPGGCGGHPISCPAFRVTRVADEKERGVRAKADEVQECERHDDRDGQRQDDKLQEADDERGDAENETRDTDA